MKAGDLTPGTIATPPAVIGGEVGRPAALSRRVAGLLFGADPRIAKQARLALAAAMVQLAWALLYLSVGMSGGMDLQAMGLEITTALVGVVAFYPAVRFGWTTRLRDSGLVMPQMLWASLSAVLGFVFAPPLRPALLQLLCVIQMYGFFHLRPRQLAITGGSSALMLALVLALGGAGGLQKFTVQQEIYPALLTLVVLLSITGLTIDHSIRRGRTSAGKAQLSAAVLAARELVTRDSLTGLLNRRRMQELLQLEQTRMQQTGRPFAVALLDLDHFKRINDTHGHAIGDEVLCRFAELAARAIRQSDTIARWGGEEFLVLMPETASAEEALAPLERLRRELRQQEPTSPLARIGVCFSGGVAFSCSGHTVAQSLANADRALYAAKAAGRDRVQVSD